MNSTSCTRITSLTCFKVRVYKITDCSESGHIITILLLVWSNNWGRDGSVGIATRYVLDGPGIDSRWGERFSAPAQIAPGAHPASCTMGTGSFSGAKRPGLGVYHPPLSSSEAEGRVELYIYSPLWAFVAYSRVNFTFNFTFVTKWLADMRHVAYSDWWTGKPQFINYIIKGLLDECLRIFYIVE